MNNVMSCWQNWFFVSKTTTGCVRDTFEHEPLDLTRPGNVRLVRLQSRSYDQSIRCSMTSNLSIYDTEYSAVSYEWGDPTAPRQEILINGKIFSIQQSLYSFLHSLVAQDCTEELLWIDALCIDQQNSREKNHQVVQMGQIYRSAATVLIWLGPAADESDRVFDYVEHLPVPVRHESSSVASFRELTQADWYTANSNMYEASCSGASSWLPAAVEAICNRTYWTRRWVLQEVLLARNPVLFCGLQRCKWLPFLVVTEGGYNPESFSPHWHRHLRHCTAVPMLQGWHEGTTVNSRQCLQSMLLRYSSLVCSDARDRIYALNSLAGWQAVPVNYGLTPAEVLSDAFDGFLFPLTWKELKCLVSSMGLSLDEFLECYALRGKGPVKLQQVESKINQRLTTTEPFILYDQPFSGLWDEVSYLGSVQHTSRSIKHIHDRSRLTGSRPHHPLKPTGLFVFHDLLQSSKSFDSRDWRLWTLKAVPADLRSLGSGFALKACNCIHCDANRQEFLRLSDCSRPIFDHQLSDHDCYIWSSALSTMYFIRAAVSRSRSRVKVWSYLCSAVFRDNSGNYIEPRGRESELFTSNDRDVSIFLYWDPTLFGAQYTLEHIMSGYYTGVFKTRQVWHALSYHNHEVSEVLDIGITDKSKIWPRHESLP